MIIATLFTKKRKRKKGGILCAHVDQAVGIKIYHYVLFFLHAWHNTQMPLKFTNKCKNALQVCLGAQPQSLHSNANIPSIMYRCINIQILIKMD